MGRRKRVARSLRDMRSEVARVERRGASVFLTPWGWMGIAETARGIARIVLPKRSKRAVQFDLQTGLRECCTDVESPRLRKARTQLTEYLIGTRSSFDFPIDFSEGTDFQRRVWKALVAVPFGQLRSYQGLAASVGGKRYARAVGNAVGANPIPIVIPCHRIVACKGTLGGFSGGLPTKRRLLALEGSLSRLRRAEKES